MKLIDILIRRDNAKPLLASVVKNCMCLCIALIQAAVQGQSLMATLVILVDGRGLEMVSVVFDVLNAACSQRVC